MVERKGTIELRGSCDRCAGVVRVSIGTFVRPRRVQILGPGGRVLAHANVTKSKELTFPVRFQRTLGLRIQSDPGPQSVSQATGLPDPRSVGISVGRTSFTFDRKGQR
jgi:hypothetical protein